MKVETYLKRHPEIKEFWLQSNDVSFCKCSADNFDDINHFGHLTIKRVEEAPEEGELITLHVKSR